MILAASHEQREALLAWAIELQSIRNSKINYPAASYLATLDFAARSGVLHVSCFSSRSKLRGIEPTEIKANLKRTKEMLWSERDWPARLVLVSLAVGTLGFAGKAAGLAAFGRAVAVPIWLVPAASGALLGVLIEALRALGSSPPTTTHTIIDAKQDGGE